MEEVLKLIGLSQPVLFAGGTYGFFRYLDNRASAEAKTALSTWLKPIHTDAAAVSAAMVEFFDRIYGAPLYHWKAIVRAGSISIVATIVTYLVAYVSSPTLQIVLTGSDVWPILASAAAFNVACDYLSLFAVRRLLITAGHRPLLALTGGLALAAALIIPIYIARNAMLIMYGASDIGWSAAFNMAVESHLGLAALREPSFIAAIVVHLWLPLFVVSVLVIQLINAMLWSTERVQWFLEQGASHPLEALGAVATAIVFIATVVIQFLWPDAIPAGR